MACRQLEVTLVSRRDIGPGSSTWRPEAYAEVSLKLLPGIVHKTNVDREGGTNPTWNLTLTLTMQDSYVREPGVEVVVKLYYERIEGDKPVGEVEIPIPALFDRGIKASAVFDVVPTGSLTISYRFGEKLDSMPVGIGKLSNLRTLSAFLVGYEEDGCSVRELKEMNKLRGTLRLLNLESVGTEKEASEACLYKKVDLRKVQLQWSNIEDEKIPHEEEILESLQPAVGIQELKIMFYSGGVFPSWICDPSFNELVTIFLYKCRYCISLPSLGELPSLKHLSIIENNVVVEIDSSFCRKQRNDRTAFPKLEKLTLESMSRLERWMISLNMGDFPSLRRLIIEYCPKLVELPYLWRLGSLSHLEIRYCPELTLSPADKLPRSLQSLMINKSPALKDWCCDKDSSKIAHVPEVYFDHHKFPPEM